MKYKTRNMHIATSIAILTFWATVIGLKIYVLILIVRALIKYIS